MLEVEPVHDREHLAQLDQDRQREIELEPAALGALRDARGQRGPDDVLADHEARVTVSADIEDRGDARVWVLRDPLRLVEELRRVLRR